MSKEPKSKQEVGKGGAFRTGKNPFQAVQALSSYPEIVDCKALWSAINQCIKVGNAVILGTTRDQGALCITILEGDQRHRTYCSTKQEVEDAAQSMLQEYS